MANAVCGGCLRFHITSKRERFLQGALFLYANHIGGTACAPPADRESLPPQPNRIPTKTDRHILPVRLIRNIPMLLINRRMRLPHGHLTAADQSNIFPYFTSLSYFAFAAASAFANSICARSGKD